MNKRDMLQMIIGLSYNSGYEQARKDIEQQAEHKKQLEQAYRKGRMAEAASQGDARRTADIMGETK